MVLVSLALSACTCRHQDTYLDSDSPPPEEDSDDGRDSDIDTNRPRDFILWTWDDETWEDDHYVIDTYQLDEDGDEAYMGLYGASPTFYLMRPENVEDEPRDVLVWFHGGAMGDDAKVVDKSQDIPYSCVPDRVEDNALKAVQDDLVANALARQEGWAILVPRNDWCDAWAGQGPDDPVDPEHHLGYYHASRVFDFVFAGGAGFEFSGNLYGWGTSMGATATMIAASRYQPHPFTAMISDSGPSSMFEYHSINHFGTDDEICEHLFGGPPYDDKGQATQYWDNYAGASGETLVSQGLLRTPIYNYWNSQDALCDAEHIEVLEVAMDEHYPADGVRYGFHDLSHPYPGTNFHTQTPNPLPPAGYVAYAAVEFLKGWNAEWIEGEDGCQGDLESLCELGYVVTYDDDKRMDAFSAAAGRTSSIKDGPGVVWCDEIPSSLVPGQEVRLLMAVAAERLELVAEKILVATLSYYEGGSLMAEQDLFPSDFYREGDPTPVPQYQSTILTFEVGDPQGAYACLWTEGVGTLSVDAAVYMTR